ncbi:hypothetical protein GF406_13580 [candidate division KSB1 bacterium]|nr:hypothetical protein [candidate division KSB1 bacterium]
MPENTQKILKELEKILSSSEFSESGSFQTLLEYLVQASLRGESPKEVTIAHQVFHKNLEQNENRDTTVRVYIHNLRKKLDSYYLNEGKSDPIRFSIPKGHYQVRFEPIDHKKAVTLTPVLYAALVLPVLGLLLFFVHSMNTQKPHPFWSPFIDSGLPVLIVFGDYYLFQDTSPDVGVNYVRNFQINSPRDLQTFMQDMASNTEHLESTDHTFLGKFAVWSLFNLVNYLQPFDKNIELSLASSLRWQDLNNYNIIFIGSFKTYRILTPILNQLNTSYQIHPNTLFYNDTESDTTFAYPSPKNPETGYVKDYTLVTRVPGPNRNTILLFSSTHDIGHIATVRAFTNTDFLNDIGSNIIMDTPYFESLFLVSGFERTAFFPKLLHYNTLDGQNFDFEP